MPRYALYYAPARGSDLERFGNRWLGRDVETGAPLIQPVVKGLTADQVTALTADPRRYGFHGTLKPPFHLVEDHDEDSLGSAIEAFCRRQETVVLPPWQFTWQGAFAALIPSAPCPALNRLAEACVRTFDHFRKAPSAQELERRRARNLTPRQDALLARWGYPYVMEDFRFHLTLTGMVYDPTAQAALSSALKAMTAPLCHCAPRIDSVALFKQSDTDGPFLRIWTCPFPQTNESGQDTAQPVKSATA